MVDIPIQTVPPVRITYEGREFLRENSGMKKAKKFCGEAFEVMLAAAIGVIS